MLAAVTDTQDMDLVANDFVANDIGIDERPLAKIATGGTSFMRKLSQATAGLEETRCDIARRPRVDLADIPTKALQIPDR